MARLLNATGYWSSVLATVCLVLALVAAPIGEARADEPELPGDDYISCSPGNAPTCTTIMTPGECYPDMNIYCLEGQDKCECCWIYTLTPACRCIRWAL